MEVWEYVWPLGPEADADSLREKGRGKAGDKGGDKVDKKDKGGGEGGPTRVKVGEERVRVVVG